MNLLVLIQDEISKALAGLVSDPQPYAAMVKPTQDPKHGDYQANCAMSLAKVLGKKPRDLAQEIADRLELGEILQKPEVAGPGFINLRLQSGWMAQRLRDIARSDRLGVEPIRPAKTFVIDFSSPNVAKPMHVGHLRSTIIGDALARLLRFLGHTVITDNHLGDWGTQFGILLYGYRNFLDKKAFQESPVRELARLYLEVRRLMRSDEDGEQVNSPQEGVMHYASDPARNFVFIPASPEEISRVSIVTSNYRLDETFPRDARPGPEQDLEEVGITRRADGALQVSFSRKELPVSVQTYYVAVAIAVVKADPVGDAARRETAKLHAGDPENKQLWTMFMPACLEEINRIYRRLGVSFDHTQGESFYNDMLPTVVQEVEAKGIAQRSDGALVIFLDEGEPPAIIQKRDGAFTYTTSDLATIRYRAQNWKPDAILYVVDARQALHFTNLFKAARRWGYDKMALEHIAFGSVLGKDGKPIKTREGGAVELEALLDEAVVRAAKVLEANLGEQDEDASGLDETARRQISEVVGLGAVKYADLSQNRLTDYKFDFDKMLAMNGNTATYMQYAYARNRSIFRKGNIDVERFRTRPPVPILDSAFERALAVALLRLEETLIAAATEYQPSTITTYLWELAKAYSGFFQNCPVLKAPTPELKESRLLLCDLTARVIQQCLQLLGIRTVERM